MIARCSKLRRWIPNPSLIMISWFWDFPTHDGWYTEAVRDLLESPKVFEGKQVAVFDTRTVKWSWIFGSEAKRLARQLEKLGAVQVREPEAFFVTGMQGPLKEGELETARHWAAELVDQSGS